MSFHHMAILWYIHYTRLQRWSFFYNDGMVMVFFFKAPLLSMVFQWFFPTWTITIECLFTDQPLKLMVFRWFFPNSGAMVSDGFDLEKDLKMRIIVTDPNPILQQLYVLFRIQITLLLVNLMCK